MKLFFSFFFSKIKEGLVVASVSIESSVSIIWYNDFQFLVIILLGYGISFLFMWHICVSLFSFSFLFFNSHEMLEYWNYCFISTWRVRVNPQCCFCVVIYKLFITGYCSLQDCGWRACFSYRASLCKPLYNRSV